MNTASKIATAWQEGRPIADIFQASPDAEFVLEDEECDFFWRRILVPVEELSFDQPLEIKPLPGEIPEEAANRWQRINDWIDISGGIKPALSECPILATLEDEGTLSLIDGWHRLVIAVLVHGQKNIEVLAGTSNPELLATLDDGVGHQIYSVK